MVAAEFQWWFYLHDGSPTSGAETDFSETDFLVSKNNENMKCTKTQKALLRRGLIKYTQPPGYKETHYSTADIWNNLD